MTLQKHIYTLRVAVAGGLLCLAGCGTASQPSNGNFSGSVTQTDRATTGHPSVTPGVASVILNPSNVAGGQPTAITVNLSQPAPVGGIAVQLQSSDSSLVATPPMVSIPSGQTSATVTAQTSPVSDLTTVAISAASGNLVAGSSLQVTPVVITNYQYSIGGHPAIVSIAPGQSGSTTVATKIKSGFDHALQLEVARAPAGISVTLTPSLISAPGAGTSTAEISVPAGMRPGNYFVRLTASDGTTSRYTSLKIEVQQQASSSGPDATFQGCWYQRNGHQYQGVHISVADPGTYAFDAYLYRGPSCQANQTLDRFGFGTPLNFGGWTFWFSDFGDQSDTSAIWFVGNQQSQCVNYAVAPPC